jgi:hypothetical protein
MTCPDGFSSMPSLHPLFVIDVAPQLALQKMAEEKQAPSVKPSRPSTAAGLPAADVAASAAASGAPARQRGRSSRPNDHVDVVAGGAIGAAGGALSATVASSSLSSAAKVFEPPVAPVMDSLKVCGWWMSMCLDGFICNCVEC